MKKNKKLDFLQIGFQKCATTFFHQDVYGKHPDINCIQPAFYYELDKILMDKFVLADGFEFSASNFINSFNKCIRPLLQENKVNGLIYEPFTYLYRRAIDRKAIIDRIRRCFPGIKIITFIRNQKSWLLSNYSEYIKSGGLLPLNDFVEVNITNPFLDSYYLDYLPTIDYLLSKGNSLVCLFEEFERDNQKIGNDIFDFLKVKRIKVNGINRNPSLNKQMLFFIRFLNHFVRYDCGAPLTLFLKIISLVLLL